MLLFIDFRKVVENGAKDKGKFEGWFSAVLLLCEAYNFVDFREAEDKLVSYKGENGDLRTVWTFCFAMSPLIIFMISERQQTGY